MDISFKLQFNTERRVHYSMKNWLQSNQKYGKIGGSPFKNKIINGDMIKSWTKSYSLIKNKKINVDIIKQSILLRFPLSLNWHFFLAQILDWRFFRLKQNINYSTSNDIIAGDGRWKLIFNKQFFFRVSLTGPRPVVI